MKDREIKQAVVLLHPTLKWTAEEAHAFRSQWVDAENEIHVPPGSWPECIADGCSNRCCLRLLSKLCHPCTVCLVGHGESPHAVPFNINDPYAVRYHPHRVKN